MTCWLAQHHAGPCLTRADGRYDRAHLIPQRRIKATLRSRGHSAEQIHAALADPRNIVYACRKHHGLLDGKAIRLRASDYPPELHEFAAEYGFAYDEARCEWYGLAAPERRAA